MKKFAACRQQSVQEAANAEPHLIRGVFYRTEQKLNRRGRKGLLGPSKHLFVWGKWNCNQILILTYADSNFSQVRVDLRVMN